MTLLNVGAAMRACAALGVDVVLFTPSCADPLYRRAVRVSMGTVFQIPCTRIDPWLSGIQTLREHGFTVGPSRSARRVTGSNLGRSPGAT